VRVGETTIDLRAYLEGFLFEASKQRQKVSSLSGGERARVALAKLLKTGSNLLLLDEPTNDLDIATLGALEEMLVGWPGCALVVTHDRYFLNRTATSVLGFLGDGEVVHFSGDYDAYRAAREEGKALAARSRSVARPTKLPDTDDAPKPLTYAERIELDTILDRIGEAEAHLAEIERELADPTLYSARGDSVRALQQKRASAVARVGKLTSRWETLESRRDAKK
jgi:ATP-binding cassette subfamily F protein uup